jgi:hypothetical protein
MVLLYPMGWVVQIGGLPAVFVGKIIIFPLFYNFVFIAKLHRNFTVNFFDFAIVFLFFGQFISTLSVSDGLKSAFAAQSHDFTIQTLNYFAFRLIITSRDNLFYFLKSLCLFGLILVAIAVYESLSHNLIYLDLYQSLAGHPYPLLELINIGQGQRFGLQRACGPFFVSISLGLFFACLIPLSLCLLSDQKFRKKTLFFIVLSFAAGNFFTISSAPIFSTVISLLILAYFPLRKSISLIIPVFISLLIFSYTLFPIFGLPLPHDALREFAFSTENADYRIGLIEEAFSGGMEDHWLFGFGRNAGAGYADANPEFQWKHQDPVNIFIACLIRFGLFGTIPFVLILFSAVFKMVQAVYSRMSSNDLWIIWCFFAFFSGWLVAFNTVSSIKQITALLYMFFGIIANLPVIVSHFEPVYRPQKSDDLEC